MKSNKITMPDYTRVGYTATHPMHEVKTDGKIHTPGIALSRHGGQRSSFTNAGGEEANHPEGQKIHSAGIPLQHMTGGDACPVPKGKMRGKIQEGHD